MLLKHRSFTDSAEKLATAMEPAAPWQAVIGLISYRTQLNNMQELFAQNAKIPSLKNLKDDLAGQASTLILVIGEATNRQRMRLYGYVRKTTPKLDAMKNELLAYTDVVSPRPYTIEVLQQVLTFGDEQQPD